MNDGLTAFLTARIDEQERDARKLLRATQDTLLTLADPKLLGKYIPGWHDWRDIETLCAAMIREVAADRELIAAYENVPEYSDPWIGLDLAIRIRTKRFSDHPDYRDDEWKP